MYRIQTLIVGLAALFVPGRQEATSQERMPTVPTKQTPPASVSLEANPNGSPPADGLIERASRTSAPEVDLSNRPLKALAWMVGEWVDQDEEATNETSVKWTTNGAFLIRSFRLSTGSGDPLTGMQIIAWDPAEKQVRSWTYDSRGGFGEEAWTRVGDRWSMRTKFTLPDGGRASAVHVMTRDNNDSFRWKSVSRVIDGSLQPDIDEVTFIRRSNETSASSIEATNPEDFSLNKGETEQ